MMYLNLDFKVFQCITHTHTHTHTHNPTTRITWQHNGKDLLGNMEPLHLLCLKQFYLHTILNINYYTYRQTWLFTVTETHAYQNHVLSLYGFVVTNVYGNMVHVKHFSPNNTEINVNEPQIQFQKNGKESNLERYGKPLGTHFE